VCTAAERVHIDRSRSHAVSARFAACALELNSGVARAAFASTRLATTRRGKSTLPPNVLVLPLSKGCTVCTVRSSSICTTLLSKSKILNILIFLIGVSL
jgi:hypothetical protein